jgi:protein TonB
MAPVQPLDDDQEDGGAKRFIFPAVLLLALLAAGWFAYKSMGEGNKAPKRQTVKIAVLPDTPPPPPPPQPKEKPPEPDKPEVKPQAQQEQVKPQETPPEPQQLKMDGPAGDGPSAFAAGQVSSEYKGGDVGTGQGGGGVNKMQFAFFTNRLTRHIQTELARRTELKGLDYRVNVRLWMDASGGLQRIELASSSGDLATDKLVKDALAQIAAIDQVPANLPQPLSLRITNRVTGS